MMYFCLHSKKSLRLQCATAIKKPVRAVDLDNSLGPVWGRYAIESSTDSDCGMCVILLQVKEMFKATSSEDSTVLLAAAGNGSEGAVDAVLAAARNTLTVDEVRTGPDSSHDQGFAETVYIRLPLPCERQIYLLTG